MNTLFGPDVNVMSDEFQLELANSQLQQETAPANMQRFPYSNHTAKVPIQPQSLYLKNDRHVNNNMVKVERLDDFASQYQPHNSANIQRTPNVSQLPPQDCQLSQMKGQQVKEEQLDRLFHEQFLCQPEASGIVQRLAHVPQPHHQSVVDQRVASYENDIILTPRESNIDPPILTIISQSQMSRLGFVKLAALCCIHCYSAFLTFVQTYKRMCYNDNLKLLVIKPNGVVYFNIQHPRLQAFNELQFALMFDNEPLSMQISTICNCGTKTADFIHVGLDKMESIQSEYFKILLCSQSNDTYLGIQIVTKCHLSQYPYYNVIYSSISWRRCNIEMAHNG